MTERMIGNYRILKQIGAGGMAKVYLAVHKDVPNLKVVLKILSSPQHAERFMQEADKLALLERNPNVCHIRHFFNHEDELVIAMEYIDGKSLEEMLAEKGRFSVDETVRIIADLLTALGSAHEKEIYHRDIKPGNVMFEKDGQLKIIDFGIAKGKTDPQMTIVGTATGTPEYMAPEQFAGGEHIDYAKCDIYAAGTMMYRMLTGRPPFKGENEFILRDAKMFEDPAPPSSLNGDISRQMDKLILKSMDKDPGRRFASALEMKSELVRLAGRPGGVFETPPTLADAETGSGSGQAAGRDSGRASGKAAASAPKGKTSKKGGARGRIVGAFAAVVIVAAAVFVMRMMSGAGDGTKPAVPLDNGTRNDGASGRADGDAGRTVRADTGKSDAGQEPSGSAGARKEPGDDAAVSHPAADEKKVEAKPPATLTGGEAKKPASTDGGGGKDRPVTVPRTGPVTTPPAAPGYLLVTSRPGHAAVYINGKLQNEPTPFKFERPPGEYSIRIVKVINGEEFVYSQTVVLKSGENIKISHNFVE